MEAESRLIEARAKKTAIEAEKITGDNIYKVLIYFDKLYKVMNDVERRQPMEFAGVLLFGRRFRGRGILFLYLFVSCYFHAVNSLHKQMKYHKI